MTLAEALSQVELEPGRTYDCVVRGRKVTVRVAPLSALSPSAKYDEEDVMLDPWCDLPPAGEPIPARVRVGELPLDIPPIPQDDE